MENKNNQIPQKLRMASFAILATLFMPAFCFSQITKDTTYLNEVVVTASKTLQNKGNVTQKIDVISFRELKSIISGNRNVAEAIQYLPGNAVSVLSRNDANWGTYGGVGPKYSTYMLQGLPIDAFVDPMGIELNAVDRIEVQRGPASVLYSNYLSQDFAGNQCPLSGTVNLVLKEKIDSARTFIGLNGGTYNTINGSIYHQNRFGRLHLITGLSYEKSDYTDYGSQGSWLNMIDHPEYNKGKLFLGLNYFLDKEEKHKLSLFANGTLHSGDAGRPNRGYDHQYKLVNFAYTYKINDNAALNAKVGYRNYDRSWQEDNYSNTSLTLDDRLKLASDNGVVQTIIPADLSFSWKHLKNSTLTAGVDFQTAKYETWGKAVNMDKTTGNDASANQTGIYAQEEFRIADLIIRGGARYNIISYNITQLGGSEPGNKSQSWNCFLWNAGLKYNTKFGLSPFVNVGTSFMTPGLKSIGGTIALSDKDVPGKNGQLPNPDLNPESGLGIDAGFDMRIKESGMFTARIFQTTVNDAIIDNVVSQNPSQTQSINAGKTTSKGFEISLKYKVTEQIEVFANYTALDTKITNKIDTTQDGAQIPFVPANVTNLGFTLNLPYNIKVVQYIHVSGKMYDSSNKYGRSEFNSHETVNMNISKDIQLGKKQTLSCFLNLYNITNNTYLMPWQFQDPGFSFMGGVKVEF